MFLFCMFLSGECLHVAKSTGNECLRKFWRGIRKTFGGEYLWKSPPTIVSSCLIFTEHVMASQGCLAVLTTTIENGRIALRYGGVYTRGYKGSHPTIVYEAVVDYRLWI